MYYFYEGVGQNLKAWVSDAPKVKKDEADEVPDLGQEQIVALVRVNDTEDSDIIVIEGTPETIQEEIQQSAET